LLNDKRQRRHPDLSSGIGFEFRSGSIHGTIKADECFTDVAVRIESVPLGRRAVERLDDPDIDQEIEIPADRLPADASKLRQLGLIELAV
jgi:hypothetical protein